MHWLATLQHWLVTIFRSWVVYLCSKFGEGNSRIFFELGERLVRILGYCSFAHFHLKYSCCNYSASLRDSRYQLKYPLLAISSSFLIFHFFNTSDESYEWHVHSHYIRNKEWCLRNLSSFCRRAYKKDQSRRTPSKCLSNHKFNDRTGHTGDDHNNEWKHHQEEL